MHKKVNRTSLLDESDNEDDDKNSNFSKNQNRFLKSKNVKDQVNNDIQSDLYNRQNSNRSVTPRSIATDSEMESERLESSRSFENSISKLDTLSGSGWNPGGKLSPKKSSLYSNDKLEPSVVKSRNEEQNLNVSILESDKFKKSENLFPRSPRDNKAEVKSQKNLLDSEKKNITKKTKIKKLSLLSSDEDNDDNDTSMKEKAENPLLKTLRFNGSKDMGDTLDTLDSSTDLSAKSKKSKEHKNSKKHSDAPENDIKANKNKNRLFGIDDEDNDNFNKTMASSSRFIKTQKPKDEEEKSDRWEDNLSGKKRQHKFEMNDFEDDMPKPSSSSRFLKTDKNKILEEISEEKSDSRVKKPKPRNKFYFDDEDDNSNKTSSSLKFLKTKDNKESDRETEKMKLNIFNHDTNEKENSFHESLSLNKNKSVHSEYNKSEPLEPLERSRFLKGDKKKVNSDYFDHELDNSTKLLNFGHSSDLDSPKLNLKPKPRKSQGPKHELKNDINNSKSDIKRRSIRFEDEDPDTFRKEFSKDSSTESSPRKSDISRHSSRKSTPSPPTSICEELVEDPVSLKLKAIQKRREEKKRQNDSKFESAQNKLISTSINSVADSQQENIPESSTTSDKEHKLRPASAKYRNVQPKLVTRLNIKSLKSSIDQWSSTPDLHGSMKDLNSERNVMSSQLIRDTAYLQWYMAKLSEEKNKNPSGNADHDDKKLKSTEERNAAFEAWRNAKKEYFLELDRKRKEKLKAESKPLEVKDNKSAELAFEVWKKQKEEKNKEEFKNKAKEKKKIERSLMKEREEKKVKKDKLMIEWEQKKLKEVTEKKKQVRLEEKAKEEKENKIKQKLNDAEKAYREWEEKADMKEKQYSDFEKQKDTLVHNRRAWRPSTNSVFKNRRI